MIKRIANYIVTLHNATIFHNLRSKSCIANDQHIIVILVYETLQIFIFTFPFCPRYFMRIKNDFGYNIQIIASLKGNAYLYDTYKEGT